MKFKAIVCDGDMIPNGFGRSYSSSNPPYWHNVCHRIPLNILVRIGYLIWIWCLWPFRNAEPQSFWKGYATAQLEQRIIALQTTDEDA